MKEVKLPSGSVLKIGNIPFELANNLKKVVLKELNHLNVKTDIQVMELCKNYICMTFSSDEVEKCLWECFKKCSYDCGKGELKIDKDSFESAQAREDFTAIQIAVAEECLFPFLKSLYALSLRLLALVSTNTPT
jgi:hypothetical protein